jgi:hypothetical protein
MKRPVIPARPTVYKGIQMRSRLEADYASALDRDGEKWEYEPTCFAGPDGQWLPDFRIGFDGILVEVKPTYLMAYDGREVFETYDRIDKILRQMTVAWLSEPETHLQLVFWEYGREQVEAPLVILGSPRGPHWVCYTPSTVDLPLLWPGMDQMGAVALATKSPEVSDE